MGFWADIKEGLLELLFPHGMVCIVCGEEIGEDAKYEVCPECLEKLPFNNQKICLRCGGSVSTLADYCEKCLRVGREFSSARSSFVYAGDIARLIQGFKFGGRKYLGVPLAGFLGDTYAASGFAADIVLPVPLHPDTYKSRRFNQAEVLAAEIAKRFELRFEPNGLEKTINTKEQARLNSLSREENLKGAFEVKDGRLIKGRNVLLIDDVLTTGATADECARVLFKHGAATVNVLTLASTKHKPKFEAVSEEITFIE